MEKTNEAKKETILKKIKDALEKLDNVSNKLETFSKKQEERKNISICFGIENEFFYTIDPNILSNIQSNILKLQNKIMEIAEETDNSINLEIIEMEIDNGNSKLNLVEEKIEEVDKSQEFKLEQAVKTRGYFLLKKLKYRRLQNIEKEILENKNGLIGRILGKEKLRKAKLCQIEMKKKILELTIKENPKLEEMLCDILIYLSNKQDGIYSEYRILESFKETFIKYYREKIDIQNVIKKAETEQHKFLPVLVKPKNFKNKILNLTCKAELERINKQNEELKQILMNITTNKIKATIRKEEISTIINSLLNVNMRYARAIN